MSFEKGDRVAWSHSYAPQFPPETVVYEDAIPVGDPEQPGQGQMGVVTGVNEFGSLVDVKLDDGAEWTLTADELVKVKER